MKRLLPQVVQRGDHCLVVATAVVKATKVKQLTHSLDVHAAQDRPTFSATSHFTDRSKSDVVLRSQVTLRRSRSAGTPVHSVRTTPRSTCWPTSWARQGLAGSLERLRLQAADRADRERRCRLRASAGAFYVTVTSAKSHTARRGSIQPAGGDRRRPRRPDRRGAATLQSSFEAGAVRSIGSAARRGRPSQQLCPRPRQARPLRRRSRRPKSPPRTCGRAQDLLRAAACGAGCGAEGTSPTAQRR